MCYYLNIHFQGQMVKLKKKTNFRTHVYVKVSYCYCAGLTLEVCPIILGTPCVITDRLCNTTRPHSSGTQLKSNTSFFELFVFHLNKSNFKPHLL